MSDPNLLAPTTINGRTMSAALTTTLTTSILTCTTNHVFKIKSILVTNIHASNSGNVTLDISDTSQSSTNKLANAIPVPANSTLVLIDSNSPLYLETGDILRGGADASSTLVTTICYEDIV